MSSQCLGTWRCGDDVLGPARSEQSQGHRGDDELNAPTVPRLQTNIWMRDFAARGGQRSKRGSDSSEFDL